MFGDFANVFAALKDGPEKTSLALRVFGKAGAELIPLLNEGKAGIAGYAEELRRLGGVVTPATAAAADEFNDQLDKIKMSFGGLALQVAEKLLPELNKLAIAFGDLAENGQNAGSFADWLAQDLEKVSKTIRRVANEIEYLKQAYKEQGLVGEGIFSVLARAEADFNAREAKMDAFVPSVGTAGRGGPRRKGLAPVAPNIKPLFSPDAKTGGGSKKRDVDEIGDAYRRMNAQMAETIALFGQTSEVAKLRYDLENGELSKLDAARKSELLTQAA